MKRTKQKKIRKNKKKEKKKNIKQLAYERHHVSRSQVKKQANVCDH